MQFDGCGMFAWGFFRVRLSVVRLVVCGEFGDLVRGLRGLFSMPRTADNFC
jgi:hypothetical protein